LHQTQVSFTTSTVNNNNNFSTSNANQTKQPVYTTNKPTFALEQLKKIREKGSE
jgi:hypothetical protein